MTTVRIGPLRLSGPMAVSVVIQGPFTHESIDHAEGYAKFGQVIFSGYVDDEQSPPDKHTVVRQPKPSGIHAGIYNVNNIYYQCYTTLAGLERVSTEFVIKLRADEFYENIEPVLAMAQKHPDKIITTDIFFRPSGWYPYNPSDHVICGKTETIKRMYADAKVACERGVEAALGVKWPSPEQVMCRAHLIAKGYKLSEDEGTITQQMKEQYRIVSVRQLGKYYVRAARMALHWTELDPLPEAVRSDIDSI